MKAWRQHQGKLRSLLEQQHIGLISDFDGTLSPFAQRPQDAKILPENAFLLDALAGQWVVTALVSGRSACDLRERFERPRLVYYGNHGMEFWQNGRTQFVDAAKPWIEPLNRLITQVSPLNAFEGVIVENKCVTASIHYRLAPNPVEMRERLYVHLSPLCLQYGFVLSEGQFIWEIIPPIHVNKGTAARAIVEDYQLDGVLFLGDDVTDYTAMDALRQLARDSQRGLQTLSVGVVHPTSLPDLIEHCDVTANGVEEVAHLLRWLYQH